MPTPRASHHQKLVVRSTGHRLLRGLRSQQVALGHHELTTRGRPRIDTEGEAYPPFHDVQMLVDGAAPPLDGDVPEALESGYGGDLAAGTLTGNGPLAPGGGPCSGSPCAIARTFPKYQGQEVREVERLFVDMIDTPPSGSSMWRTST
jgi:phospholipase D1/2